MASRLLELKTRGKTLLRLPLRQPFLATPLRFPLLSLLPDARLFVVPTSLQFSEEPFARKLFLGNLERFFDVIIEDFDFHLFRFRTFPGDACANLGPVPI